MRDTSIKGRWVTASALIGKGECELVCAIASVATASSSAYFTIYNGEDAAGEKVIDLLGAVTKRFNPKEPVYCPKGIYVAKTSTPDGLFVQWRELGE